MTPPGKYRGRFSDSAAKPCRRCGRMHHPDLLVCPACWECLPRRLRDGLYDAETLAARRVAVRAIFKHLHSEGVKTGETR